MTDCALENSGPSSVVQHLVKDVIIGRDVLATTSPCGQNCTYELEFEGPVFECFKHTSRNSTLMQAYKSASGSSLITADNPNPSSLPIFLGSVNATAATDENVYRFDLEFILDWTLADKVTILSCVANQALYRVNTSYSNGKRTLSINTTSLSPIDTRKVEKYGVKFPASDATPPNTPIENATQPTDSPIWDTESLAIYCQMNSISIARAMGLAFSGNISVFGTAPSAKEGTMILDSPLNIANGTVSDAGDLKYNLDPHLLEQTLRNITVSLISLDKWSTVTPVTQSKTTISYSFSRKYQLIIPYASTLALSFLFILLAGLSLINNGVSHDTSFIQILSSTVGSSSIRKKSAAASVPAGYYGIHNIPKELKQLKVRFGTLLNPELSSDDIDDDDNSALTATATATAKTMATATTSVTTVTTNGVDDDGSASGMALAQDGHEHESHDKAEKGGYYQSLEKIRRRRNGRYGFGTRDELL